MSIRVRASYTVGHGDLTEEQVEVELETDDDYRPDVADDMVTRLRRTFRDVYAGVWPAEVEPVETT